MATSSEPNWATSPSTTTGRNQLALVSLLLSPIFAIGIGIRFLATVLEIGAKGAPPSTLASAFMVLSTIFGIIGVPSLIAAIIIGHVALVRAKRYPPAQAQRWMAIIGLVIGYLSLLFFVGVIVLFLLASLNGF